MTRSPPGLTDPLNSRLAWLLGAGTWVSCGFIATGMILSTLGAGLRLEGAHFVSAGIVLLIALPALCVAMTGVWFLLSRDLDFALVAAFVLAIIIVSARLGAGAAVAAGPRARGAHGAQLARSFTTSTKPRSLGGVRRHVGSERRCEGIAVALGQLTQKSGTSRGIPPSTRPSST